MGVSEASTGLPPRGRQAAKEYSVSWKEFGEMVRLLSLSIASSGIRYYVMIGVLMGGAMVAIPLANSLEVKLEVTRISLFVQESP